MEEKGSIELKRPRQSFLSSEKLKMGGLLLLFLLLLYLLYDMAHSFSQSWKDSRLRRESFLNQNEEEAISGQERKDDKEQGQEDVRKTFTLYFASKMRPGVLKPVDLSLKEPRSKKELIAQLIELLQEPNPANDLAAPLPEGCKLLAIFLRGKDLYIDLSSELHLAHSGSTLECYSSLQALTNTLSKLEFVDRVKYLVAGKERLTLKGHFDLSQFWTFDAGIVEG